MKKLSLFIPILFCAVAIRAQCWQSIDADPEGFGDFGRDLIESPSGIYALSLTGCRDNTEECSTITKISNDECDSEYHVVVDDINDIPLRSNSRHCIVNKGETFYIAVHSSGDSSELRLIEWDNAEQLILNSYMYKRNGRTLNHGMIELEDNSLLFMNRHIEASGSLNTWVIKSDFNGNILWEDDLDTLAVSRMHTLASTLDSGWVIGYSTFISGLPNLGHRVAKYDKSGELVWITELSADIANEEVTVENVSDGTFIVSSEYVNPRNLQDLRHVISHLSADGDIIDQNYFTRNTASLQDILELSDGNFLISGIVVHFEKENRFNVGWVIKYSLQDGILWERIFTETDIARQGSIFLNTLELHDKSLMLIGQNFEEIPNTDPPQRNQNTLVVKLDSMGCLQPDCGEVQVITSIDNLASPAPSYESLFYPNPTTGQVYIQNAYDWTGARYTIYNHQGARLSAGIVKSEIIQLQADLPDGLYIIQMMDKDKRYTERVVLQR